MSDPPQPPLSCAACRSQRRGCNSNCIFRPYFPANEPEKFACVKKIYGISNVGKMLELSAPNVREQVANCLYVEAQCRVQDPVYGIVGIISDLNEQIHNAEIELAEIKTQIDNHKLQNPHVEAETNFNVPSTVAAEPNINVLPEQSSSKGKFQ